MQTVINYGGVNPPVAIVEIFNSATAFPSQRANPLVGAVSATVSANPRLGGSFHLLNQQWFQYTVLLTGGTATGLVEGQFSNDGGATWVEFYDSGAIANATVGDDEVYVGMFKDVRFLFTPSAADATLLNINMALNDQKPTSKTSNVQQLHNDTAIAATNP